MVFIKEVNELLIKVFFSERVCVWEGFSKKILRHPTNIYGKYYFWVFWSLKINEEKIEGSKEFSLSAKKLVA